MEPQDRYSNWRDSYIIDTDKMNKQKRKQSAMKFHNKLYGSVKDISNHMTKIFVANVKKIKFVK